MNEIIKVNYDNDLPTAVARDLYQSLEIGSEFSHWFKRMCECGFSEGIYFFAGAVETSKSSILIGELAKILKQNGINIGQNRLFEWMRQNGYLIRRNGSDYNMPTQRAMEMGLFEIEETTIVHADGHTHISKTPKVTGKGQVYFVDLFLSGKAGKEWAK